MATGFISHQIRFWNLCPSECSPQEEPDILSASLPSWRYTPITHRRPRKVPFQPEPFNIPASTTQPKSGCLNGGELLRSRVDETDQSFRQSNQSPHCCGSQRDCFRDQTAFHRYSRCNPTNSKLPNCCIATTAERFSFREESRYRLMILEQISYPAERKLHCCNNHPNEQPTRSRTTVIQRH